MADILLGLILLVLVGAFALLVLAFVRIKAIVLSFVVPPGENQPSPIANAGALFADMIARALMAQAKTFLMGVQSGESKRDMAEQLQANPLLEMVPKNYRRHPIAQALTNLILSKIVGMPKSAGLIPPGNGKGMVEASNAPKFKL